MLTNPQPDLRRYFRPFFLDPASGNPTPYKRYYDIASFLATQLAFSFATCPFLILSLSGSLLVWARVYFYAIIGTAACAAFFASPAKPYLRRRIEERAARAGVAPAKGSGGEGGAKREGLSRSVSTDSVSRVPVLGLPSDAQREIDEAVAEIRMEVAARQAAAAAVAAEAKKSR